jgi:hypothetical protein
VGPVSNPEALNSPGVPVAISLESDVFHVVPPSRLSAILLCVVAVGGGGGGDDGELRWW